MSKLFLSSGSDITSDISRYFLENDPETWEIMRLVPTLLKKYLVSDLDKDMDILRASYGQAVSNYEAKTQPKSTLLESEMDSIVYSAPVRRLLLHEILNIQVEVRAMESVESLLGKRDRTTRDESGGSKRPSTTKDPTTMATSDIISHLARSTNIEKNIKDEKFSMLDLTNTTELDSRSQTLAEELKRRLKCKLESACTRSEREWLLRFGSSKTQRDVDKVLQQMFALEVYTSTISYIRTAINCLSNLWRSGVLSEHNNEGWLQANLYSQIFDSVFMEQTLWITKRSETLSMTLKTAREGGIDVADRRIDFILMAKDDTIDLLTAEDKAKDSKKVATDLEKTSNIQQLTLYLWRQRLGSQRTELISELEAMACQWTATKLRIYGTRLIGSVFVHYKKAEFKVPMSMKCGEASLALLTVLSLKVYLKT
ncbi:hypothetical protein BGW38_005596 [Lunasporangiospora selenospora]|uniref:Uncharacterized protein n=1 Tax=Lunasporangiospora selenospora TaxID=979761 RepID=A0A9P6KBA1_9FUNG|nr:hypothetical protein BGW38_005596 [Lunasporangiospora selenospora]